MAKKINIKAGDIFSIKVSNNQFVFGRILFDIDNQYLKIQKEFNKQNYLSFFKGCILIETYRGIFDKFEDINQSEKIIEGSFISNDIFSEDQDWQIIGNLPVDPKQVSFPEVLVARHPDIYFCVGEIAIKVNVTDKYREDLGVYPSFGSGYWEMIATLDYSGRKELIEDADDILDNYFKDSDLRALPEKRKELYDLMKEDLNSSYYELALKFGFDLSKYY